MCKPLHLALLLLMFVPSAWPQETPNIDVFGGYSYDNADTKNSLFQANGVSSRQSLNGWEASVSGDIYKWLAAEGDFSGHYKSYDVSELGLTVDVNDFAFGAGPRINFRPAFVHALVGVDHLSGSALGFSASQNSFAAAFGGGIQAPMSSRWAIRASADYVLTRHNIPVSVGGSGQPYTQNSFRVSAGIVFSFGGTHETSAHVPRGNPKHAPSGTEQAALFGVTGYDRGDGFFIDAVSDVSPAAAAGIRPGDVIMTIDAQPVHSAHDIESAIATSQTGTVRVMYFRSGVVQTEVNVKVR